MYQTEHTQTHTHLKGRFEHVDEEIIGDDIKLFDVFSLYVGAAYNTSPVEKVVTQTHSKLQKENVSKKDQVTPSAGKFGGNYNLLRKRLVDKFLS